MEGIAGELGVLVHVGPLVVMAEYHRAPAELRPRGKYALTARIVGERLELVKCNRGSFHGYNPGNSRPAAAASPVWNESVIIHQ